MINVLGKNHILIPCPYLGIRNNASHSYWPKSTNKKIRYKNNNNKKTAYEFQKYKI